MSDNRIYWIWLAEIFGKGSKTAAILVNRFRSARKLYEGAADMLEPDNELDEKKIAYVREKLANRSLDRAEYILARCENLGINVITCDSGEYPRQLRTMINMPLVLYVRGRLPDCERNMLTTIVGTRMMTDYGRTVSYSLGAGLAYGGSIVVSGMALGADSMGMLGALDAGGTTIAVLGSGVDFIYPKEHKEIYYKILDKGAIISEYPPGTPPIGSNFPVRNRLMSGLSDATVVVEANLSSGALITARLALSQGKRLFAVPGKVGDDGASGTNQLIRDGALPCICAEDILSEFEFIYGNTISVNKAHAAMRNFDADAKSADAMARMRIGSSFERKNYYGVGTYGGRARDTRRLTEKAESERKVPAKAKPQANKEVGIASDFTQKQKNSVEAKKIDLDMLDENELKVYNKMKANVPTLPDELVDGDTPVSMVMSALTMLEMTGAVESGGGGYFMRVVPEDISESEND